MWNPTTKKGKVAITAVALGAVIVLVLAFSAMAREDKKPHYEPGTYLASADGIGTVIVAVEVSEDKILDIDLDVSQESADVGGVAAAVIRDKILADQTVKVDEIAGATTTSKAVKEAVDAALRKASLAAVEAAHKAELDSLNTDLGELQNMVDSLTSEKETLAREKAEMEEANKKLQSENDSQKTENEDLKAENEKLSEMNASLEKELKEKTKAEEKAAKEAEKAAKAAAKEAEKAEKQTEKTEKETKEDKKEEKKEDKEEETEASEETEEAESKELLTEVEPEETSHNLVSMQPVEEAVAPSDKSVVNDPAFAPFYLGSNMITSIQEALENLGYSVGGADGYMGPGTQDQLINYQNDNGLAATGTITPETVMYLLGYDAPGIYDAGEAVASNAEMEAGNLLEFSYTDIGVGADGESYQVGINITNRGSSAVTGISMDIVWYNQYGYRIATTNTVGSGRLKPGKSTYTEAILKGDTLIWNMASMGVGAYTFHLSKPDENGFSTYHVNLLTGEVQGS